MKVQLPKSFKLTFEPLFKETQVKSSGLMLTWMPQPYYLFKILTIQLPEQMRVVNVCISF